MRQLPPALARWLAANGHEAEHVLDLGLSGATDLMIWDHAARADAIIVTKDEDFAQRKTIDLKGPKAVWDAGWPRPGEVDWIGERQRGQNACARALPLSAVVFR